MGDNDTPKPSPNVSLRLTPDALDALDALVAVTRAAVPRHRLMVAAITHGARALAADPQALLPLLGLGGLLAAVEAARGSAAASPTTAAAAPPKASASQLTAGVVTRATPPPPPDAAATSSPTSASTRQRAPRGPRDEAPPEAVEAMRVALRAAVERGASVNAVAVAAGMTGGGTRRRLGALLDGEAVTVSRGLAAAVTAAAERAGRG